MIRPLGSAAELARPARRDDAPGPVAHRDARPGRADLADGQRPDDSDGQSAGAVPVRNYEYLGVFDPAFYAERAGVYAVDPYQPGKVPVVLVYGLWSSPKAWVPMLDALRSDPALRASYQFWVVLYPSGYSLPTAALSIRRSLREIRRRFDPAGTDPALDRMIVVGKSTGGQTSRLLVQSSGEALWDTVFTRPIDQIRASPALPPNWPRRSSSSPNRTSGALSSSRRAIAAATWPASRALSTAPIDLIRRNNPLRPAWAELRAANGPDVFRPPFRDDPPGSVDGMRREPLAQGHQRPAHRAGRSPIIRSSPPSTPAYPRKR